MKLQAFEIWLSDFWHWLWTTPYCRALEARVAYLEADNLALRDRLLEHGGFRPLIEGVRKDVNVTPQPRTARAYAMMREAESRARKPDEDGRPVA